MKDYKPPSDVWAVVYRKLHRAWEETGGFGSPPPAPLIKQGDFDFDSPEDRWRRTLQWAEERGLQHLIPKPRAKME